MFDVIKLIENRLNELGGEGLYSIEKVPDELLKESFKGTETYCLIVGEDQLYFTPNNLGVALKVIKGASWNRESYMYICRQILFAQNYLARALEQGFVLDATSTELDCLEFFYKFSNETNLTPGRLLSQILQEFKRLHDSEPELAKLIAYNDFSQN